MIEINDFIKERGGDPEKIRESQRRRYAPVEIVDEIIDLFEDHRKTQYGATQINGEINAKQKEIGAKKKVKENADDLLKEKADLEAKKKGQEELAAQKLKALYVKVKTVGNYVHESVPVSGTEDDNRIERTWVPEGAKVEKKSEFLSHHEVLHRLGGVDFERGVKVMGHRGYCLIGKGVFLNRALESYGLEFLDKKGYIANDPPYMMLREQMAKTAQLEQFDEELYKVTEKDDDPTSDKYLIATSEQPLSVLHSDEWLQPVELPIKYAGTSTCYRKEAGSHGKDAWGIFRTHQFQKIEQFLITHPEKSWEAFDEMIATSEEFYKSLNLPYQVVSIVSGALNNAAAKKYDLEAWFPFQGEYKELVSCSNCTDYQTRELEIRFGTKKQTTTRKEYCHALNSTLTATGRTLCCILENYQTPDGINIPEVLRQYIPGQPDFLPFVKELPKESTSTKVKAKAGDKAPKEAKKAVEAGAGVAELKDLEIEEKK
ncbi:serine-tRNA ligase [Tothia fuscella]|uniref:serine--tRNA ligase n=1 Tax=Tothia fuscella TaxID=1048955 RepID=A0A9P4NE54_9PEZI|nr:serine-tRNA ligase [Tothia fuscella]